MSNRKQLRVLFLDLFTTAELELFVDDVFGRQIVNSVNWNSGATLVAADVVDALDRRGFIEDKLFEALIAEKEGKAADIRRVHGLWFPGRPFPGDPPPVTPDPAPPTVHAPVVVPPPAQPAEWWRRPIIDWTLQAPRAFKDTLIAAYPAKSALINVATLAGISQADFDTDGATGIVWPRVIQAGAASGNLANLIDRVLEDSTTAAFHPSLRANLGDFESVVRAAHVHRVGLQSIGEVMGDPDGGATGLQAIVDAEAGLYDTFALIASLLDMMSRTAMIEIGGHPVGTAFLVGDQHVLTNAHVVGGRKTAPAPDVRPVVSFDRYPGEMASSGEQGLRVGASLVPGAWSLPTATEVDASVSDWNAPPTNLDYALLKLDRAVGAEPGGPDLPGYGVRSTPRGFFQLSTVDYDFARARVLMVLQHPAGARQIRSDAKPRFTVNGNTTRVKYRANTAPGSSGSGVYDHRGRLVALHHYGTASMNQGVPISAIAHDLEEKGHGDFVVDV